VAVRHARTPAREFPQFPAALSFLPDLPAAEAAEALAVRTSRLRERLAALEEELTSAGRFLPRLFLIESEYQVKVVSAELAYVAALIEDLRAERITWPFRGRRGGPRRPH
jgi:hypothetical protein